MIRLRFLELTTKQKSLPESLNSLPLRLLVLSNCDNIESLFGSARTLQRMAINGCPNLTVLPEWLSNLSSLRSDLAETSSNLAENSSSSFITNRSPSGLGSSLKSFTMLKMWLMNSSVKHCKSKLCLSGSSDSMIRLWDLGQQRCVHSYAVHTGSVWALASTRSFSHVYSGGRDLSLYLTDLATRESLLLCTGEHPVLQLAMHDDSIWVATTDSSVHRWPAEGRNPQKSFQRGGSFLAGNLSFSRARVSLEGSTLTNTDHSWNSCGIVQHEILNNRRHVLTKDTAGSVKLWEITRGIVVTDYGKVSFEEKKEELFEMVSIPACFTADTRLGSLSIHLDTPQCFSAEMYSADLNIAGKPEDDKVNLARETLKGLLAHWLAKRKQRFGSQPSANGDLLSGKDISHRSITHSRIEIDSNAENDSMVYPPFEFSTVYPPSIITEGSHGGPWRKKITDFDGTEDDKDFPFWCLDCVLNNRLPPRENTKCSFYLHPCEGSTVQILTQGKLSAPRILRIHKVINYVIEKMVLDKPLDSVNHDGTFAPGLAGGQLQHSVVGDGSFRSGLKPWQKLRPSIEILCNNQVLAPDMSLATVRAYIWTKSVDLVLNYRVVHAYDIQKVIFCLCKILGNMILHGVLIVIK
ncbi:WD repeat-containing protein 48-like, partial [Fagus crenata]